MLSLSVELEFFVRKLLDEFVRGQCEEPIEEQFLEDACGDQEVFLVEWLSKMKAFQQEKNPDHRRHYASSHCRVLRTLETDRPKPLQSERLLLGRSVPTISTKPTMPNF